MNQGHEPTRWTIHGEQLPELSARAVSAPGAQRRASLDPATLREGTFGFLAQLAMPGTEAGHVIVKDGQTRGPMYFCLTDPRSQAWARVATDSTTDRQVTQGRPAPVGRTRSRIRPVDEAGAAAPRQLHVLDHAEW